MFLLRHKSLTWDLKFASFLVFQLINYLNKNTSIQNTSTSIHSVNRNTSWDSWLTDLSLDSAKCILFMDLPPKSQ